jgi:hypothetical protein
MSPGAALNSKPSEGSDRADPTHEVVSAGDGEVAIAILEESAGSREAALSLRDQLAYLALAQTAMPSSRTFSNTEKSPRSARIP